MKRSTIVLLLTAITSLTYVGTIVVRHERVAASEGMVFLELAPVDPLSMFQGQYMNVEFKLERERFDQSLVNMAAAGPTLAVIELDDRKIGTVREFIPSRPEITLKEDLSSKYGSENYLLFKIRIGPVGGNQRLPDGEVQEYKVWVGQQQFMFQENMEERYRNARYGCFRVAPDGSYVLVDLADDDLNLLSTTSSRPSP